jgi:C4-dicarboxylate-specific signal transduction histidine kinase
VQNAMDAIAELDEKWIKIETTIHLDQLILTVTDSGTGIAEKYKSKIMEPFFTTKEPGKGTGLGLSISKGIIANHKGVIELNSSSPNTQFVITLPLSEEISAAAS